MGASTGYNLQTLRDQLLFMLQAAFTKGASSNIPDAQVFAYLNAAQDELTNLLKLPDIANTAINLVSGTALYDLPSDISTEQVRAMYIRRSTYTANNGDRMLLDALSMAMAANIYDLYNIASSPAGEPGAWTRSAVNPRKFLLLPPPNYSMTGGIEIYYTFRPSRLTRLWSQLTITCDVGYNDSTVLCSASVPDGLVQIGDEFGITSATNTDASTTPLAPPRNWYRISEIAGAVITLATPWLEPAVAAGSFITAQVPDLERYYPGRMQYLMTKLAAAEYYMTSDGNMADRLRAQAIAQADLFIDNLPDERTYREQPGMSTNFFSRGR